MTMPNSQWLLVLVVAMVAGVILFRLFTVLGRRTGSERPAKPDSRPRPVAAPQALPEPRPAQGGGNGLLDIQLADKGFDTEAFISGARAAYQLISTAFEKADRAALRPLLADDVYAAFDAAIGARAPDAPVMQFTGLKEARIVDASLQGKAAHITLAFIADFALNGESRSITDVWSFARQLDAGDPNWVLVATGGDLPG